jgi:hypothetical protein
MAFNPHDYEFRIEDMGEEWVKDTAESWANATLSLLKGRGVAVPDEIREQLFRCTDLGKLAAWMTSAATVGDIVRC